MGDDIVFVVFAGCLGATSYVIYMIIKDIITLWGDAIKMPRSRVIVGAWLIFLLVGMLVGELMVLNMFITRDT